MEFSLDAIPNPRMGTLISCFLMAIGYMRITVIYIGN